MEVMSNSFAVDTPQAITRPRPLSAAGYQQYPAPASQESIVSIDSIASSQERLLHDSSSNVSQLTNLTDVSMPFEFQRPQRPRPGNIDTARVTPPEEPSFLSPTSPMSIVSPVSVSGAKRTASGHVKNAFSYSGAPLKAAFSPLRSRAESFSSTGSRAGELAASLKMRLGYAMAKVQHGWESKNILEIDSLAARAQAQRYSAHELSSRPVTAGYTVGDRSQIYSQPDLSSPPSKRRSGTFGLLLSEQEYRMHNASMPHLDPPVDIQSTQHHRLSKRQGRPQSTRQHAGASPRTPIAQSASDRPPILRTDTQTAEAERDALQALTQLGSPHNSHFSLLREHSQTSSSQASPLRSEFNASRHAALYRGNSASSEESVLADAKRPAESVQ